MRKLKVTMSHFTQGNLEAFFLSRKGWKAESGKRDENLSGSTIRQETKGDLERRIDIIATHESGYALSIIAGGYYYSTPGAKSETFSAVEIGLLGKGKDKGLVYLEEAPYFDGDVESYVEIEAFNKMVKFIESGKIEKCSIIKEE